MPWQEQSVMSRRQEFIRLARTEAIPFRHLCRRFGISHTTGYTLMQRVAQDGPAGLVDRSRRPTTSPRQTPPPMVAAVVAVRDAHPTWGGRKIHHRLVHQGLTSVPHPSTITDILRREGRISREPAGPVAWQRFEHAAANDLWQMDFMGHRPLRHGRVHPLSVLDDHSRYGLWLAACPDQRQPTVQAALTACFRRYGLPQRMLFDNGPPWGTSGQGGLTALEAWLIRLGITVAHGAFYHPQTQGKVERWHRTIGADVFTTRGPFATLNDAQRAFDAFRHAYNGERPHGALDHAVPASRYLPSPRRFPEQLPDLVYAPDDHVLKVRAQGAVWFRGRSRFVSRALIGQHVGIRPTLIDGVFDVRFGHCVLLSFDLREQA